MTQLTRSKIAYDLSISPHRLSVSYGENSLEYVFSSELYKKKFLEKQKHHRETINNSLSRRFGVKIKNSLLADIKLYTNIEKRGFLLLMNGDEARCLDNLELDGENLTLRNSEG